MNNKKNIPQHRPSILLLISFSLLALLGLTGSIVSFIKSGNTLGILQTLACIVALIGVAYVSVLRRKHNSDTGPENVKITDYH